MFWKKWAVPGLFYLFFDISLQLTANKCLLNLPLTGFEPGSFGAVSNRSANCKPLPVQLKCFSIPKLTLWINFSDPEGLPLNGVCRLHSRSTDHLSRPFSSAENRKSGFVGSPPPPAPPAGGSMYFQHSTLCPEVARALNGVMLIAEQKKRLEESTKVCCGLGFVGKIAL